MTDIQDMTDNEWHLHQARQWAARRYRAEGYDWFAKRVERGDADDSSLVRIGLFFHEPQPPISPEFVGAWDELTTLLSN